MSRKGKRLGQRVPASLVDLLRLTHVRRENAAVRPKGGVIHGARVFVKSETYHTFEVGLPVPFQLGIGTE
jgi:hypothetical protein